jgi:hypothetical protein
MRNPHTDGLAGGLKAESAIIRANSVWENAEIEWMHEMIKMSRQFSKGFALYSFIKATFNSKDLLEVQICKTCKKQVSGNPKPGLGRCRCVRLSDVEPIAVIESRSNMNVLGDYTESPISPNK